MAIASTKSKAWMSKTCASAPGLAFIRMSTLPQIAPIPMPKVGGWASLGHLMCRSFDLLILSVFPDGIHRARRYSKSTSGLLTINGKFVWTLIECSGKMSLSGYKYRNCSR
jgi:hypothetical protein